MDGLVGLADPVAWASSQFGAAELGDVRRTRRLAAVAAQMAGNSSGTIPQQTGSAAAMKAAYRLFDTDEVTHAAVIGPHLEQTRVLAAGASVVFLLQDTMELNLTGHRACEGLGPIGSGGVLRGLHQQNVLAADPLTRRPVGLMYQKHHRRKERGKGHTRVKQRNVPLDQRESYWWVGAIKAIGPPPEGVRWVHVGDRGEDIFGVYEQARCNNADWLIRSARDRSVTASAGTGHLFEYARSLPAAGKRKLTTRRKQTGGPVEANLSVAFGEVGLRPVKYEREYRDLEPIRCSVVRVWETDPPKGVAPLEWMLLTSLECTSPEQALRIAEGYALRWLIEEFHKCEKTGCQVQERRLQHVDRLEPLLGLLSVLAVWLLTLKYVARDHPDQPAAASAENRMVHLMARSLGKRADTLTIGELWRGIGRLGGHPGRKGDGPVGWLRAWRGWQNFQLILFGAGLASPAEARECG